jgi:hypothetical protein
MARLELSIQPSLFDLFYEEFLNQFMAGSDPSVAAQEGDRHSYCQDHREGSGQLLRNLVKDGKSSTK